jgi:hypothetical protein
LSLHGGIELDEVSVVGDGVVCVVVVIVVGVVDDIFSGFESGNDAGTTTLTIGGSVLLPDGALVVSDIGVGGVSMIKSGQLKHG